MNELRSPLIDPSEWCLDPQLTFLNHGSFGACPIDILDAQRRLQRDLERSPVRFYLDQLPHLLSEARSRAAGLVGAPEEGLVFVSNASEGVATALDMVEWRAGDEVIVSGDTYPACRHMLTDLSGRFGVKVRVAQAPFAGSEEEWRRAVYQAFHDEVSDRTRLILIDHITSPTALVYPVAELVALARACGAISLVDGAHAPAQLDLNLTELNPDFYTGNLHKWVMTPKSGALLYISPRWRERARPRVISHGYLAPSERRLHSLFDWVGTRDYSALCVLPQTLDWIESRVSLSSLRARNHQLAMSARELISATLWPQGGALPPASALAHMAAIPLPSSLSDLDDSSVEARPVGSASSEALHPLQRALIERSIEVPVINTAHGVMIRVSAQAYNSLDQYERLADILVELSRPAHQV